MSRRRQPGPYRVFLLSPASCSGQRARLLFSECAQFDLARSLRTSPGVEIGDVFSFLSGLYFRGKLTYARAFARPPAGVPGTLVITPGDGLRPPETVVDLAVLERYAATRIDVTNVQYTDPLLDDARALAAAIARHPECDVVLLGSIASGKYVDLLSNIFGSRLRFPADFVGRGDMSRGGLLLRRASDGQELGYAPVTGSVRRGSRPPRLVPVPGILKRAERS